MTDTDSSAIDEALDSLAQRDPEVARLAEEALHSLTWDDDLESVTIFGLTETNHTAGDLTPPRIGVEGAVRYIDDYIPPGSLEGWVSSLASHDGLVLSILSFESGRTTV